MASITHLTVQRLNFKLRVHGACIMHAFELTYAVVMSRYVIDATKSKVILIQWLSGNAMIFIHNIQTTKL